MAEGTAAIGVQTRAIANIAIANESKAAALGFGLPALSVTAVDAELHGTASLTTTAATLSGTATETFSGTGALESDASVLASTGQNTANHGTAALTTTAASLSVTAVEEFAATGALATTAASLSGTATETFSATGALSGVAASLSAEGTEDDSLSGTVALTSAASALDSSGSLSYNGVVALESAAASLSAVGPSARRQQGGHDVVDLAGYTKFVERGNAILEELGQPVAGTGATDPELDPVPTLEITPPDYREFLAKSLDRVQLEPVVVPPLEITGKSWVRGHAAQTTEPIWLAISSTNQFEFDFSIETASASLGATGEVDRYYWQRRQEDAMIKDFIITELYGARVA